MKKNILKKIEKEIEDYGYGAIFKLNDLSLEDCYELYNSYNYKTNRTVLSNKNLIVSKDYND